MAPRRPRAQADPDYAAIVNAHGGATVIKKIMSIYPHVGEIQDSGRSALLFLEGSDVGGGGGDDTPPPGPPPDADFGPPPGPPPDFPDDLDDLGPPPPPPG